MTKIIIIEDNPTYNTFISKFLAKAGFKSIQVHRLFTAKKHLLEAGDDDIVLAALRLSDGESTELLRWMKDNDRLLPFRLQGYVITAPPLRDCPEDIMPLAGFFREVSNRELERAVKGFDSSAREALLLYTWPGNVRELKQKIQRAVLQAESDMITEADLELDYETIASTPGCFALRSDEEEKERIIRALEHTNGNKILAAKLLGIGRTTLYTKMEKYEITIKKTIR